MLKRLTFISALGFASVAFGEPVSVAGVNAIRLAAGLPILSVSAALERSAMAHSDYLARHMPNRPGLVTSAHEQRKGLPEFSGHLASERATHFGYPHTQVLENISLGNVSLEQSVADLMSAIYHRFAFLDFNIDEIGAAQNGRRYVYNMGIRDLAETCRQQPPVAEVDQAVSCLGKPMLASSFQALCADLPQGATFRQPYANRCENGEMLTAEFMQDICKSPPGEAVLKGSGRYFDACGDGTKIDAKWMNKMCSSRREGVIYPYSGQAYQICTPAVEVHAEWYQALCNDLPMDQQYPDSGRFYQICQNGFKIKTEFYEALNTERLLSRPEVVIWPPDGAQDIKPAFFEEDPHPTPDLPMTGYPISIQFNPKKVESVSIKGFSLERQSRSDHARWLPVPEVRSINQLNDIQQKFSAHQFAWFPLQRLEWGANYRYRVDALVNGAFRQFQAQFSTATFDIPLYSLSETDTEILVLENRFILYHRPDTADAFPFSDIELQGSRRADIEAKVIDPNTVELRLEGGGCSPVTLRSRLGDKITIRRCKQRGWRSLF